MKKAITIAILLIIGFYSGKYQNEYQSKNRAIEMFENGELPQDKIALTAIEWIIYGNQKNRLKP